MELPVKSALLLFWDEPLHPDPSPFALYPIPISLFLPDWYGGSKVLLLSLLPKTHQGLCPLLEIQGRPLGMTHNCDWNLG